MTIIQKIAMTAGALKNCQASGNTEWAEKHSDELDSIAKNHLPSGSGIDCGTLIDKDKSGSDKVVLLVSFHHMDEMGGYDGWTEHNIIITPAFTGLNIRITGKNKNMIKDYLADTFNYVLQQEYK